MATYTTRTRSVAYAEWVVPAVRQSGAEGASWTEVERAIDAAAAYLQRPASDDDIRIYPEDEAIVVSVKTETRE